MTREEVRKKYPDAYDVRVQGLLKCDQCSAAEGRSVYHPDSEPFCPRLEPLMIPPAEPL